MICVSKSLSGLGLPFSLLMLKDEIDVWKPGEDNGTFRGNNLTFVTAVAAIVNYWSDTRLEQHISQLETIVTDWLSTIKSTHQSTIKATRGLGLIHGIEFFNPDNATTIAAHCFENGLIIKTCGSDDQVLKLLPTLTISEEILRDGLTIINNALEIFTRKKPLSLPVSSFQREQPVYNHSYISTA